MAAVAKTEGTRGAMADIRCGALTPERMRLIAERETHTISRPIRLVFAVGGAYLFYYGTDIWALSEVRGAAISFAIAGIIAVLYAIFCAKLKEVWFFAGEKKRGAFPASIRSGADGLHVHYAGDGQSGAADTEQVFAYAACKIEACGEYFKVHFQNGARHIYLFKKDFGQNAPEAFILQMESRP